MAGRNVAAVSQTVTAQSNGYVTVGSVTGFYKGARAYVFKQDYAGIDGKVTEIVGTTQLGIAALNGLGTGENYGRTDLTNYAPETRLDYNTLASPFTVGKTVTGGTSTAHGVIAAIFIRTGLTGTLVLTSVVGTFQAAETITDNNGVPGSAKATAAQYSVSATVSQPEQTIYNPNNAPLN